MRETDCTDVGNRAAFVMRSTPSRLTCHELAQLGPQLGDSAVPAFGSLRIVDLLSEAYPVLSEDARWFFGTDPDRRPASWERINGFRQILAAHVRQLEADHDPVAPAARRVLEVLSMYAASLYADRDRQPMNGCMDDRSDPSRVRPARRVRWPDDRTWRHETRGLASTCADPRDHAPGAVLHEATQNRATRRAEAFGHSLSLKSDGRGNRHTDDPPPRPRPASEPRIAHGPPAAVRTLAA